MFTTFFESLIDQLSLLRVADAIDILLVTVLVYIVLKFIRDTHTTRLLKGVVLIVVVVQLVYLFNLHVTTYILSKTMQLGFFALVIIFQPELRRALEQVGKTSLSKWFTTDQGPDDMQTLDVIKEVSHAAQHLSNDKTGALIVIERGINIDSMISSGVKIDAVVTSELLVNVFVPNTPLHDGAVVIRENRLAMAACVLPLTQNPDIRTELGTRHRAGIGISEEANVIVVIVSEETGYISVAVGGILERGFNEETLKAKLIDIFELSEKHEHPKAIHKIFSRKERH